MIRTIALALTTAALLAGSAPAQIPSENTFPALGAPANPRVQVSWNRFHDVDGLHLIVRQLAEAYPDFTNVVKVGTSVEGRDILALELAAPGGDDPAIRPAMYIDGNIHGNEVQSGEVVLYTAWYLLEMYDTVPRVKQLLDTRTFYLLPTINPDGRDSWFHGPANPHMFRGGNLPVDNDGDGLFDEDGPQDLDGDGQITMMRIRDPFGTHRVDPEFPDSLMIRVKDDERGEYRLLGWEGIDNDGDGEINEDGPGGYDPNRNWPHNWQPESTQFGAMHYPFSLPETRAISEYVRARPNIAAVQSYHNNGGMILRGPGDKSTPAEPEDDRVAALIGARGEEMLPYYNSWVTWKDLYRVFGGETEWFYGMLGIISFTNEMWTDKNLYMRELKPGHEGRQERQRFIRHLLQDQGLTPWKEFDHPTYGRIEIGGMAKNWGRVPPSFLIEEELHRNMASTLFHAAATPLIRFDNEIRSADMGGGVTMVRLGLINDGLIPTRLKVDQVHGITARDVVTVDGAEVIAAGVVTDRFHDRVTWQKVRPERLELETIDGNSRMYIEFLLKGEGTVTFTATSVKGGVATTTLPL